jgi:hypothetical protein
MFIGSVQLLFSSMFCLIVCVLKAVHILSLAVIKTLLIANPKGVKSYS